MCFWAEYTDTDTNLEHGELPIWQKWDRRQMLCLYLLLTKYLPVCASMGIDSDAMFPEGFCYSFYQLQWDQCTKDVLLSSEFSHSDIWQFYQDLHTQSQLFTSHTIFTFTKMYNILISKLVRFIYSPISSTALQLHPCLSFKYYCFIGALNQDTGLHELKIANDQNWNDSF